MSEKHTSRTGGNGGRRLESISSQEDKPSRRGFVMTGLGVLAVAGLAGGTVYYGIKDEGVERVANTSDEYGKVKQGTEAGSKLGGDDRESENTNYNIEPIDINASAEDVSNTYVAALNKVIEAGQTMKETQTYIQDYSDAYLVEGWEQEEAHLLSSADGEDLLKRVANRANLSSPGAGQLKLHDFHAIDEGNKIYPVVEVQDYDTDTLNPQPGYALVIKTKYARIELTMVDDEQNQRQYIADAQIIHMFNQPDVVK